MNKLDLFVPFLVGSPKRPKPNESSQNEEGKVQLDPDVWSNILSMESTLSAMVTPAGFNGRVEEDSNSYLRVTLGLHRVRQDVDCSCLSLIPRDGILVPINEGDAILAQPLLSEWINSIPNHHEQYTQEIRQKMKNKSKKRGEISQSSRKTQKSDINELDQDEIDEDQSIKDKTENDMMLEMLESELSAMGKLNLGELDEEKEKDEVEQLLQMVQEYDNLSEMVLLDDSDQEEIDSFDVVMGKISNDAENAKSPRRPKKTSSTLSMLSTKSSISRTLSSGSNVELPESWAESMWCIAVQIHSLYNIVNDPLDRWFLRYTFMEQTKLTKDVGLVPDAESHLFVPSNSNSNPEFLGGSLRGFTSEQTIESLLQTPIVFDKTLKHYVRCSGDRLVSLFNKILPTLKIELVCCSLTVASQARCELRRIFYFLDKEINGVMSKTELIKRLKEVGWNNQNKKREIYVYCLLGTLIHSKCE